MDWLFREYWLFGRSADSLCVHAYGEHGKVVHSMLAMDDDDNMIVGDDESDKKKWLQHSWWRECVQLLSSTTEFKINWWFKWPQMFANMARLANILGYICFC